MCCAIKRVSLFWMLPVGAALMLLFPTLVSAELDIPSAAPTMAHVAHTHTQDTTLWTQTMYGHIPQNAGTHRLVVWCDDSALLYSLNLYLPGTNNTYTVDANSIRLNGVALNHYKYSAAGDLRTDLLQGGPLTLEMRPLALSEHGSLMMPIRVAGGESARIVVDMTYVAGPHTTCGLGSFEPSLVGEVFVDDFFGGLMHTIIEIGTADFNEYLDAKEAGWRLEPETHITRDIDSTIEELSAVGIQTYLGFPDTSSLQKLADTEYLVVSCCATSRDLDREDRIFRTAPSDEQLGTQMAHLMRHNGADVLLIVWRTNDVWETGYRNSVADAFAELGGIVDEGIGVTDDQMITIRGGADATQVAAHIIERVSYLTETHGADNVAVFVATYGEAALLEAISQYEEALTVRWFGTDYVVGTTYTKSVFDFASAVEYTALQVKTPALADEIRPILADAAGQPTNHDMLAAYESVWILGLAMEYAQSSDPARLAAAIPYIADRYSGTLGPMTLDSNGDLLAGSYEVWSVHDRVWVLVGVME